MTPPRTANVSAREKSPNSPRTLPLLPGRSLSGTSIQTLPKMLPPFIFPPSPVLAGSRQEPDWGAAPLPGVLGFVGSPLVWHHARARLHFPAGATQAAHGSPGLATATLTGKRVSPGPAFWAPSELVLSRRSWPTSAAAMSISVAGGIYSTHPNLSFPSP